MKAEVNRDNIFRWGKSIYPKPSRSKPAIHQQNMLMGVRKLAQFIPVNYCIYSWQTMRRSDALNFISIVTFMLYSLLKIIVAQNSVFEISHQCVSKDSSWNKFLASVDLIRDVTENYY